jgi:hypothetical protein
MSQGSFRIKQGHIHSTEKSSANTTKQESSGEWK